MNHNNNNSLDSNRTSRHYLIINKGTYFGYSNHRLSRLIFQRYIIVIIDLYYCYY